MGTTAAHIWNLRNCALVLFSILLTILTLERMSSFMLNRPGISPAGVDEAQLRLIYGVTSSDELHQVTEMLDETWRKRSLSYTPLAEYREAEFTGRHVSIAPEGYRRGAHQEPFPPQTQQPVVMLFGGSNTFGYGVRDSDTIASNLQDILGKDWGWKTAVFNFGSAFDYSTIERIRFEKLLTQGITPRIAVFIDGPNEFVNISIPDKSAYSYTIDYRAKNFTYFFLTRKVLAFLLENSQTVKYVQQLRRKADAATSTDAAPSPQDLEGAAKRLLINRRILRAMCQELGIMPVFVQQPVPAYHYDNAKRAYVFTEAQLGRHAASRVGYEILERWREQGLGTGQDTLYLQDFSIPENQYIDSVHYSPKFNRAIAHEIARHIAVRLAAVRAPSGTSAQGVLQ